MGDSSFWSGVGDNVSSLFDTYLKFRTAEAQADAVGTGQAQLNAQVEHQQGNGQVPLTPDQLQTVTGSGAVSGGIAGLTQNQLIMGVGALALVFLIAKK